MALELVIFWTKVSEVKWYWNWILWKSGDEIRTHEAYSGTGDIGVKYSWGKFLNLEGKYFLGNPIWQNFFSAHTGILDFLPSPRLNLSTTTKIVRMQNFPDIKILNSFFLVFVFVFVFLSFWDQIFWGERERESKWEGWRSVKLALNSKTGAGALRTGKV